MRLQPRQRRRPLRYGTRENISEIDLTTNLSSMRQEEKILSKKRKVSMFDRNWTISRPSFGTDLRSVVNEFRRRGYFVRKKDDYTFMVYWCSEHPGKIVPCSESCECRQMLSIYFNPDGVGRGNPRDFPPRLVQLVSGLDYKLPNYTNLTHMRSPVAQ